MSTEVTLVTTVPVAQVSRPSLSSHGASAVNILRPDGKSYDLKNQSVLFPDQSRWLIDKALSKMALQQTFSPCEARQVFTAFCVEDPASIYRPMQEAIIKIKYQVRASDETIRHYMQTLSEYRNDLLHHQESLGEIQEAIDELEADLYACTHPVVEPNDDTVQEITALRQHLDHECQSAPQLLGFAETEVDPCIHEYGIVGGYVIIILMSKVPGSTISYETLCKMSSAQRDDIRQAFKQALSDVWASGVHPNDKALRNIVWDAENRRCYIVDFEDCRIVDATKQHPPEFHDTQFQSWDLDEARILRYRRVHLGLEDEYDLVAA